MIIKSIICDKCSKNFLIESNTKFLERKYLSFNNDTMHLCIGCAKTITFYEHAFDNYSQKLANKEKEQ